MEYGKEFVIIGNINAVTYKEFFPLVRDNKVWIGPSIHSGDREFRVPDDYPLNAAGWRIDEDGRKYIRVKGVRWYTNIDVKQRHVPIDLRGNYYKDNESKYPHYCNYDGINVDKVSDIPCDYSGVICVPITFLDKYCPDQFEILGVSNVGDLLPDVQVVGEDWVKLYRSQGGKGHISPNMKSLVSVDDDGKAVLYYRRLAIRRKDMAGT